VTAGRRERAQGSRLVQQAVHRRGRSCQVCVCVCLFLHAKGEMLIAPGGGIATGKGQKGSRMQTIEADDVLDGFRHVQVRRWGLA
jgi:hypothetical protein